MFVSTIDSTSGGCHTLGSKLFRVACLCDPGLPSITQAEKMEGATAKVHDGPTSPKAHPLLQRDYQPNSHWRSPIHTQSS